jgi:outer membrane immunogenic protein
MALTLKKIAFTILLLPTIVLAGHKHQYKDVMFKDATPCQPPQLLDGFYIGAQGGYDSYKVNEKIKIVSSTGTTNSFNPNVNPNGFAGGFMFGYGSYFSNLYYLGGEFFAIASNATSQWSSIIADITGSTPGTYDSRMSSKGSYGIAMLPGLKITDTTLTYVRLGYTRGVLKYHESATTITATGKTNVEAGFAYGLGIESLIANNWSMRGEFTYTNYGSFTTKLNVPSSTTLNSSDSQFMVGILYHYS